MKFEVIEELSSAEASQLGDRLTEYSDAFTDGQIEDFPQGHTQYFMKKTL